MAIYAIGDIQGCYDPFRELLDALRFDPDKDTLWLTGDLVNRGPKSLKTVRFVKSLGDSAITVLGNHDLHLLALAAGQVKYGNRFESLKKILKAKNSDELLDWIRHLPLAHYDESLDTLLVHAGTHPLWTVKKTLARAAEVEDVLRGDELQDIARQDVRQYSDSMVGRLVRLQTLSLHHQLPDAHAHVDEQDASQLLPQCCAISGTQESHSLVRL